MKIRNIKILLKTAYSLNESDSEKQFIRAYEEKHMQLWEVVKVEFGFMGIKSALAALILLIVLFAASFNNTEYGLWCVSSMLPLFAMLVAFIIGSSERYEMDELESACRFSLSFVRMVRMLIIGVISLVLLALCIAIIQRNSAETLIVIICCVSCPYLLNIFGCLFITRKIHNKEDIFACAGITCFTCLLPTLVKARILRMFMSACDLWAGIALLLIIILTVRESIIYVQEGDKKIWNLC